MCVRVCSRSVCRLASHFPPHTHTGSPSLPPRSSGGGGGDARLPCSMSTRASNVKNTQSHLQQAKQRPHMIQTSKLTWKIGFRISRRAAAVGVAVLLCSCLCFGAAAQDLPDCPRVWSTAALSVARYLLAATSLPDQGLAIFAGGLGMHVCRDL